MKLRESNLGSTWFGEGELNQGFHVGVFLTLKCQLLSRVKLFAAPWTVAHQAHLSMGIFRARILEWVAIPFSRGSSQRGIKPGSPALQMVSLPSKPPGKPPKSTFFFHYVMLIPNATLHWEIKLTSLIGQCKRPCY